MATSTYSVAIHTKVKASIATSCLTNIPRNIVDSVGFIRKGSKAPAAGYHKRSVEFEGSVERSEEGESSVEETEENIPDIVSLLVELECLSLIFKLWLRRINLTGDSVKHHKLQDFEHVILTTLESVIKPYKKLLMLNQYKGQEELLSELMVQNYCQKLEEQWSKISTEKEKAKFEMTEEDRISMNKNTIHVCFFLGLKLDFLDGLEDVPPSIRDHRSLCDWVVRTLRNNYKSLGLTDKDSLDKEMLISIGFDPLSSAVETILTRAGNMQQHIDACEWAEMFVEDEFKYNLLFSQQNERFPFQSKKTNEWFKPSNVELNSYDDNCPCQVNIVNLVTKESEASSNSAFATRFYLRTFEDEQHTLLFHGTDHESAIDILDGRGIHLWSGRHKRDFSSGKGFYLTKNVNDALNWASRKTARPAVLVFRVNNHTFLNSKTRKLTLNQHEVQNWREIVTSFRSGKRSSKTKQILSDYDLIEGPLATVRRGTSSGELVFEPEPSSYQMCLISDDFAESFQKNLHSILFY